jgi:hypothetical protein
MSAAQRCAGEKAETVQLMPARPEGIVEIDCRRLAAD